MPLYSCCTVLYYAVSVACRPVSVNATPAVMAMEMAMEMGIALADASRTVMNQDLSLRT
jgi:hypothetical protein